MVTGTSIRPHEEGNVLERHILLREISSVVSVITVKNGQ